MAFVYDDRVHETSRFTGTGNVTLDGVFGASYQAFGSVMANGDTTDISIFSDTQFEICLATYSSSLNALVRGAVYASSNSDAAVDFGAGQKSVIITMPASKVAALVATASETVAGVVELATTTEAATGTDTARAVTPAGLAARTPAASETASGLVELATDAETITGTDTARAITPANLAARTSTESRTGIVELATTAEAVTGSDTARAVTPAGLTARMAAPGAIGGTTAAAGAFTTLSASGLITANGGQIAFPATANPSANANTLDDYEEGTFTPVLTFVTPGDLSISYAAQLGSYNKIGNRVFYTVNIVSSAFTHTTASSNLTITGLPFTAANVSQQRCHGTANVSGITKASYTQFVPRVTENTATLVLSANGSGVGTLLVDAADVPTGGTVVLRLDGSYLV